MKSFMCLMGQSSSFLRTTIPKKLLETSDLNWHKPMKVRANPREFRYNWRRGQFPSKAVGFGTAGIEKPLQGVAFVNQSNKVWTREALGHWLWNSDEGDSSFTVASERIQRNAGTREVGARRWRHCKFKAEATEEREPFRAFPGIPSLDLWSCKASMRRLRIWLRSVTGKWGWDESREGPRRDASKIRREARGESVKEVQQS